MSEKHRNNFKPMKEMDTVTNKSAEKRMWYINGFLELLKKVSDVKHWLMNGMYQ